MSIDLVREKIMLDSKLDKEVTQILLEGDIIVPDIKPDISVILRAEPVVNFDRLELSQDRVNYSGKLDIQVLYLAKGAEKPVHSMSVSMPVDDFINIPGITKNMWVETHGSISNFDYKMLNDRKISYKAVVDMEVTAQTTTEQDIVVDISNISQTQILKSALQVNKTIENKEDRFIVKDEITLPSGKPNIREILQYNTAIANKEVKISNGKIAINGELIVSTLYKGEGEESIIEFNETEVPFNGAFEVAEATESMYADIALKVQSEYIQAKPDADGEDRMLELEVSIGAIIKVSAQEELEVLEDAYCINKTISFTREKIKYPKLVCRNRNQTQIKEVVVLDGECPNILQVFRVSGKAHLDDIKIIEDKVIVEGIINADMLYVAGSDETPLYSYSTVLPFKQIVETRGAMPDMSVFVETSFDHIGFNMLSEKEVELRFLVTLGTNVIQEKEVFLITDVHCDDMDKSILDNMASMTVYVVQKGDTLWKIAKRYNTSIDELLEINELDSGDKLYPAQKLLILKKVVDLAEERN